MANQKIHDAFEEEVVKTYHASSKTERSLFPSERDVTPQRVSAAEGKEQFTEASCSLVLATSLTLKKM